jgi:tRNA G46 methylase TrmB
MPIILEKVFLGGINKKKGWNYLGVNRSRNMFFKLVEFIEKVGIENIKIEIKTSIL